MQATTQRVSLVPIMLGMPMPSTHRPMAMPRLSMKPGLIFPLKASPKKLPIRTRTTLTTVAIMEKTPFDGSLPHCTVK